MAEAYAALLAYREELMGEIPPAIMPLDGFVARICEEGDEDASYFETPQQTIMKADDRTIYLLQDVNESVLLPFSGIVLDLNGHALTSTAGSTLTIKEGEISIKIGTIAAAENCKAIEASGGDLTLDGITFAGTTLK